MKNDFGKTREVDKPYAVYKSNLLPDWEWRVLKTYKSKESEEKDSYARWFCAVKSPMTYGSWEYGDTYISDILQVSRCYLVDSTKEWNEKYAK